MTIQRLVERYSAGVFTADHLIVESLQMIEPADPGAILEAIPDSLLGRFRDFLRTYRPGHMATTYGTLPTTEQVEAARRWLANLSREVLSQTN